MPMPTKRTYVIWENGEEAMSREQRDALVAANAIYECDEHGFDDGAMVYHVRPDNELEAAYAAGTGPFAILDRDS